jgi:hypothetical protein
MSDSFMPSNENKMSDGGRERASLGVEVWKSFQIWSAQRSAVRFIGWLDGWCPCGNLGTQSESPGHPHQKIQHTLSEGRGEPAEYEADNASCNNRVTERFRRCSEVAPREHCEPGTQKRQAKASTPTVTRLALQSFRGFVAHSPHHLTRIRRMFVIKGEHFSPISGHKSFKLRKSLINHRRVGWEFPIRVCSGHGCRSSWSKRLCAQATPGRIGCRCPAPGGESRSYVEKCDNWRPWEHRRRESPA